LIDESWNLIGSFGGHTCLKLIEMSVCGLILNPHNKIKTLFTRKLDLNLRNKLAKYYSWSTALYSAET
jgi:hypothetical protein